MMVLSLWIVKAGILIQATDPGASLMGDTLCAHDTLGIISSWLDIYSRGTLDGDPEDGVLAIDQHLHLPLPAGHPIW